MFPWVGYYINLDRSPERRASIERQLATMGISSLYKRFSAVDGSRFAPMHGMTPGELGCARSHAKLLSSLKPNVRFVHILEDDAVLAADFSKIMMSLIESGALDQFDIVFTDVFPFDTQAVSLRKLKSAYDAATSGPTPRFGLIDLRGFGFGGTNSYFVNVKSLPKVLMAVNGGFLRGQGPQPIDLVFRRDIDAKILRGACVFPFISAVDVELGQASTIADRSELFSSNLLRQAFYVDCDLNSLKAFIAPLIARFDGDRHMDVLADIYRLTMGADAPNETADEAEQISKALRPSRVRAGEKR